MSEKTNRTRERYINRAISSRAQQLLALSEQRPEPQRTELRRLALDLHHLGYDISDVFDGLPRGESWAREALDTPSNIVRRRVWRRLGGTDWIQIRRELEPEDVCEYELPRVLH